MKIFCLGSNKTGTVSLTTIMKNLGYTTPPTSLCHAIYLRKGLNHSRKNMEELFHTLKLRKEDKEFFVDIPFNLSDSHKILNEMFPEAHFILTIRNPEKWFDSVLRWIKLLNAQEIYNWIWKTGVTKENKSEVISRYNKRNFEIINFFKNNPKFLPLYIEEKNSLKNLCLFLGKEIIEGPFPHKNINQTITKI